MNRETVDGDAGPPRPRRYRWPAVIAVGTQRDAFYRPDIDGLRALAVLAVIGFHAAPDWMRGGYVGVDVFFVISGFLISNLIFTDIRQSRFSFCQFYARRIRRIFPALGVVLITAWLVGWCLLLPAEFRRLGRDIIAAAGFASNIAFWHDVGYFDQSTQLKPLLHLWSLGVEEQYYIVWPLVVFLAAKIRRGLPLVMAAAAVASFVASVAAPHSADAFYLPHARFWELLAGAGIAYAKVFLGVGDAGRLRNAIAITGLTLLAIAVLRLNPTMGFPGWWALLPVTAAAMLIAAGPSAVPNRFILGSPPLVFIGLISYPLYLWHWLLLSFARLVAPDILAGSTIAGLVAMAFALACLTYVFVELPIRRPRQGASATRIAPALTVAIAATGVAGIVAFAGDGFPARFPAVLNDTKSMEIGEAYRLHLCFVRAVDDVARFADECVDPAGSANKPLLFLWGDSHAAHLYPGLHELQQREEFRIAQYTIGSCPPFLAPDIPNVPFCRLSNRQVLKRIAELRPDWVILSAIWGAYSAVLPRLPLDETVEALKGVGVKNILIVGPNPNWKPNGLARMLYDSYLVDGTVPWRIDFEEAIPRGMDRDMDALARRLGVDYASLVDILCNSDGCLTRVGDQPTDITYANSTHFSIAGSRYVADHLSEEIFRSAP